MPIVKFTFNSKVNISAQEGDKLYFCNTTENQGGNTDIIEIGEITDISRTPFIYSIAGSLSPVVSSSYSMIGFNTFNQGVDDNMTIKCIVSGSTAASPVLAQNVLTTGTTITNVSHTGSYGTTCNTSVPALDTVGGNNYEFQLQTPGETILEVSMSSYAYGQYFYSGIINTDSFILFSKDNDANLSSMLGYYADIQFKNFSDGAAELFSVGAEITPSSK